MRNRERGSALVELGIVIVPLLGLIFSCLEMDRLFLVYNAIDLAAAAGVRTAAVQGYYYQGKACDNSGGAGDTTGSIKSTVQNFAGIGLLNSSNVTVTVGYPNSNCNIGSPVTVSASYTYDPLTGFFPYHINISTTAEGTISY
jgi:Flp pilus assembly protein TadG